MNGYAPGWVARCPYCSFEVDLESLGWIRIGAYSWGKRHAMRCPDCNQVRAMRILHVDQDGNPDQPFSLVLRKNLQLQVRIWLAILLIPMIVVSIAVAALVLSRAVGFF